MRNLKYDFTKLISDSFKAQANAGRRRELYYFRDQQGLEVDFLMPRRGGSTSLIECKAGRTVTPGMAGEKNDGPVWDPLTRMR